MIYDKEEIAKAGWNKYKRGLQRLPVVNLAVTDKTMVITELAEMVYENLSLWWVILEYNNLTPVPNLEVNTNIKMFSLRDLDRYTAKHLSTLKKTDKKTSRELL